MYAAAQLPETLKPKEQHDSRVIATACCLFPVANSLRPNNTDMCDACMAASTVERSSSCSSAAGKQCVLSEGFTSSLLEAWVQTK
jgi:hypothetical protein